MRFVRGGELFMHLRNAQRFTEDRAKFYAIQVAMAIGHLHDKKIIYRDLKPENILLDTNKNDIITEFHKLDKIEKINDLKKTTLTNGEVQIIEKKEILRNQQVISHPMFMKNPFAVLEKHITNNLKNK